MPASMPGINKNVFNYQRDLNKAKQLLAEAGYPNGGFTLKVTYLQSFDRYLRVLGVLTSNLGDLGIKLQAIPLTWGAVMDNLMNQETAPDMVIAAWWADYADQDGFITGDCQYFFWGSRESKDYWYYNSTLDQLLTAAAFEVDTTKRNAMYDQAQVILVQDAPAIWVGNVQTPFPFRKEVQGFVYNPMYESSWTAYDMWKEAPTTASATSATTSIPATPSQPSVPSEYVAGIVLAVAIIIAAIVVYRRTRAKKG